MKQAFTDRCAEFLDGRTQYWNNIKYAQIHLKLNPDFYKIDKLIMQP